MHIKTAQNYKFIPSVIPFFIFFSRIWPQNVQNSYKYSIYAAKYASDMQNPSFQNTYPTEWSFPRTLDQPEYAVGLISCRNVRENRRKSHFPGRLGCQNTLWD